MERAYIIGNGPSRKGVDLSKLPGKTFGCNALYRDFEPEARFSLYKKRGVVYTHKFGLPISPIDYENNNVKTIS